MPLGPLSSFPRLVLLKVFTKLVKFGDDFRIKLLSSVFSIRIQFLVLLTVLLLFMKELKFSSIELLKGKIELQQEMWYQGSLRLCKYL